jgi:hypothetical protein
LLDRDGTDQMQLDVYAYALSPEGAIEDVAYFSSGLELETIAPRIRGRAMQIQTAFGLTEGDHDLRFLVRDRDEGRTGAHRIPVRVPPFDDQTLVYPPLFMADPADWLVLPIPSRGIPRPDMPFRIAAEAFTPRARPILENGRTQPVCVMAYTGGDVDAQAEFELGARLLTHLGGALSAGRLELTQATVEPDGFRRFVLDLTPAEVPPGDYAFEISLRNQQTGAVATATQQIRVN